jgi:flagellar protein FlaI
MKGTIKEKWGRIWHKELKTLSPYDPKIHEPLVEFEVPDGYTEIERYWVDEPYAFISILDDTKMLRYQVVEPSLTTYEKEMLERVYEDLQDVLTLTDTSKADKDAVLTDKTLFLFKRYRASLDVASMHRIMYYLRRNFRGYEKIDPLLLDSHIEDISCDGVGVPVFLYHRKYRNIMTNIAFEELELNSFVIKMCQKSGKQISIGEPMVDATMSDGSRLQATLGRHAAVRLPSVNSGVIRSRRST